MPFYMAAVEYVGGFFLWEHLEDVFAKSGEFEIRCRAGCGILFCRSRVKGKHSLCSDTQGWNALVKGVAFRDSLANS